MRVEPIKRTPYVTEKKRREATAKKRKCLSCQNMFPSEGPHNQMCLKCKTLFGVQGTKR